MLAAGISFHPSEDAVEVRVDGKTFTTFHYAAKWDKPFLHPLRTASGAIVTRRWPVEQKTGEVEDHTWQRGLWWTHGDVNGVDYWRELGPAKTGRLVLRAKPRTKANRLEAVCDFIAPGGKRHGSVLQQFAFVAKDGIIWIDVTATVRADAGLGITMGDTEEGSLGARFSDDFREDRGAVLLNSEGLQGTKAIWGKRAKWVDYSTVRDGKRIGVAILDHPSNPRHPTYWHARGYGLNAANPFGVRDFTRDKSQNGKIDIPPGGELRFRYRVVIHEGVSPEPLWQSFASVK